MTAKEMFEKLGYEYYKEQGVITYINKEDDNEKTIEFIDNGLSDILVRINEKEYYVFCISLEELQAINKQVEELGWEE